VLDRGHSAKNFFKKTLFVALDKELKKTLPSARSGHSANGGFNLPAHTHRTHAHTHARANAARASAAAAPRAAPLEEEEKERRRRRPGQYQQLAVDVARIESGGVPFHWYAVAPPPSTLH